VWVCGCVSCVCERGERDSVCVCVCVCVCVYEIETLTNSLPSIHRRSLHREVAADHYLTYLHHISIRYMTCYNSHIHVYIYMFITSNMSYIKISWLHSVIKDKDKV